MSLKAFHLFFIIVSTLSFGGFGVWCVLSFAEKPAALPLVAGLLSFAAGVAMIPYSFWFLRKLKNVSFL